MNNLLKNLIVLGISIVVLSACNDKGDGVTPPDPGGTDPAVSVKLQPFQGELNAFSPKIPRF